MTKPNPDERIDIEKVTEESREQRDRLAVNANSALGDLNAHAELLGHQLRAISRIDPNYDLIELDDARHLAIKALVSRVKEVESYATELADEYERLCGTLAEEEQKTHEKGSQWMDQLMADQKPGARKRKGKKG